jgi:WD40 repeat protein
VDSGHTSYVVSVEWSPDGDRILTTSGDGTARIWDAATGQERATLRGNNSDVGSAAWSHNGRYIVTADSDGAARQYLVTIDDLLALAESRLGRGFWDTERETYGLPTPTAFPTSPEPAGTTTPAR